MYCVVVYCLSVVAIALSDLTCNSGQTYVKFIKRCGVSWASEESYEIYSGSTLLYTGTGFANSETRTTQQCLTTSTNDQYTVKMIDSYGDSWYTGAYLAIYGKNGNIVFKNFLADSREESYTFSLYYGVDQSATWKMVSGSVSAGWTAYSFSDSTWLCNYFCLGHAVLPQAVRGSCQHGCLRCATVLQGWSGCLHQWS